MSITVGENSYIDIEGANEYFENRLHAESWGQADDSTKEKALKQTKEIDRQTGEGERPKPSSSKSPPISGYRSRFMKKPI